jgi:hypothetical protein
VTTADAARNPVCSNPMISLYSPPSAQKTQAMALLNVFDLRG